MAEGATPARSAADLRVRPAYKGRVPAPAAARGPENRVRHGQRIPEPWSTSPHQSMKKRRVQAYRSRNEDNKRGWPDETPRIPDPQPIEGSRTRLVASVGVFREGRVDRAVPFRLVGGQQLVRRGLARRYDLVQHVQEDALVLAGRVPHVAGHQAIAGGDPDRLARDVVHARRTHARGETLARHVGTQKHDK